MATYNVYKTIWKDNVIVNCTYLLTLEANSIERKRFDKEASIIVNEYNSKHADTGYTISFDLTINTIYNVDESIALIDDLEDSIIEVGNTDKDY